MDNEAANQNNVMCQDSIPLVVRIPAYLHDFLNQLVSEGRNKHQIASRMLIRVLYKQQRDVMRRSDRSPRNENKGFNNAHTLGGNV
jgi:hypothetical protein